jgi:uncharacterized protein (TIGR02996 family)
MATLREALEAAIAADFDDLATHMAYADLLSEQGDPRGELIQAQLALEDESLPAAERRKLRTRERQLLKKHQRGWLGELAPFLRDNAWRTDPEQTKWSVQFTFERGWLTHLNAPLLTANFARALKSASLARCLCRLELAGSFDDEFDSDLSFQGVYNGPLDLLQGAAWLKGLRDLRFGELRKDEIVPELLDHGEVYDDACTTRGDAVLDLIEQMPRLEELRLHCTIEERDEALFEMRSLSHLRVLQVHHCHTYSLDRMARNPSLRKLEQVLFMPHAVWPGGTSYLPRDEALLFLRSRSANKLTHLQLRMSDLGDSGVNAIIDTGLIRRLEVLDLRHGEVTDEGALALAKAIPAGRLQRLDLQRNRLTPRGIEALAALNLASLRTDYQQEPDEQGHYTDQYLYDGDWE